MICMFSRSRRILEGVALFPGLLARAACSLPPKGRSNRYWMTSYVDLVGQTYALVARAADTSRINDESPGGNHPVHRDQGGTVR